ncbi:MAG: glycosyltransferase family 9 protein [Bacteroidia bacterium]|nr:glycosyltransferase family 9 protein [Bacteroidia bacterium]
MNIFKALLYKKSTSYTPKRILVFRTGYIGDTVCALPALMAIRKNFASAQVDVLINAEEKNESAFRLLVNSAQVNTIINYRKIGRIKLFKLVRKTNYNLFIDLTQYDSGFWYQLRNLLLIRSWGIKHAFGWKVHSSPFFKKTQENKIVFENERTRLLKLLFQNGLNIENETPLLIVEPLIVNKIETLILSKGLQNKNKNIGVVIGSKRRRNKWPIDYFMQFIQHYSDYSYNLLILGNEDDRMEAQRLMISKQVLNFCGDLSVIETAELIKHCSCVITNDTGPMHLAYAVGTPIVAMFSARDFPNKWYPPDDEKHVVLRSNDMLCSACFTRECFDNVCMKKIKPKTAIGAVGKLLKRNMN